MSAIELGKRGFCGSLGLTRASTVKLLSPRRIGHGAEGAVNPLYLAVLGVAGFTAGLETIGALRVYSMSYSDGPTTRL